MQSPSFQDVGSLSKAVQFAEHILGTDNNSLSTNLESASKTTTTNNQNNNALYQTSVLLPSLQELKERRRQSDLLNEQLHEEEEQSRGFALCEARQIGRRVEQLDLLSTQLEKVINNKSVLLSRLNQPIASPTDTLVVHRSLQHQFVKLLKSMALDVASQDENVQALSWIGKLPQNQQQLEKCVCDLDHYQAMYQRCANAIQQTRKFSQEFESTLPELGSHDKPTP
eukprot:TRINITY_DN2116_c0_g1_i1.p2 TRINITY_DN2116_c0_g1~~TRINITY_DN2116_c0_g1_i1.p2  ORF type:complete len:226 (+),score=46.09 TRINITY_DN2116_c0_g1_i1:73-750(+)